METTPAVAEPKKSKKWVIIVVLIILGFGAYSFLPFLSPLFFEWRAGDKSDRDFDRIMEMIKPAPAKEYQFHTPSKEALNRTIDCKSLKTYQEELPTVNPLCLNLYKATAEDIQQKIAQKDYDRVILYGEKIIFDAPTLRDMQNFGTGVIAAAKFNDQITVPTMMKLYGFEDLSFVNKLTPNKVFPYAALYVRLSKNEEVQKICSKPGNPQTAGCARGMWSVIVPESVLGEPMSLANQKVWRISEDKNREYLMYDYKWPINCQTDETMLHEIAHIFLYANRIYNPSDVLVSQRFFNEHQADTVKILSTNLICGEGSVINFRNKDGKQMGLTQFNAMYPPTEMGSAWPKPNEGCKLAMLNEWNRFLSKGTFEKQFASYTMALKDWMKEGKTMSDDSGLANFLMKLNADAESKTNLQYRGCYL